MKKLLSVLSVALFMGSTSFAAKVKIGATPVPHAEILNHIKPILVKEGVEIEIIEFTDYVTPNLALNDGDIQANFFQHQPYLHKFSDERGLKLAPACSVHVEPLGVFSQKVKSIGELKEGAKFAIPNDPSNGGRALILLHNNGIITLKDPDNLYSTEADIAQNPKKLKFVALEAAQLPRVLRDVDAAVINGNFALEADLNPAKDSILIEGKESPYANILVVKEGSQNNEDIAKIVKILQSETTKQFIDKQYKGAVVPAF